MAQLNAKEELGIVTDYLLKAEILKDKNRHMLKIIAFKIVESMMAQRRVKAHRIINKLQHSFEFDGEACEKNMVAMLAQQGCEEIR